MDSSSRGVTKSLQSRLLLVSIACLVLALTFVTWAVASDPQEVEVQEADPPTAAAPAWLSDFMAAPPSLEAVVEETKDGEADGAEVTPAEIEAASTAFEDLTAPEAADVAAQKFPELVKVPIDLAPDLTGGESIASYPTPNSARLELPGGEGAVVESLLPLITTTADGEQVPVDLTMGEGEGVLVPANPIVPVRIGMQLAGGFEVPSLGLTLTPTDGAGIPLQGSATIEGAVAHFANTQADTDTVVKPIPLGLQTHSILRSPASPENVYFRVTVAGDEDPTLTQLEDGAVLVEANGRPVTAIPPARARDAADASVPVEMAVEGDLLVLGVDHRTEEYLYPIDLDPTAVDYDGFSSSEGQGNWVYETNAAHVFEGGWDTAFGKLRMDNGTYPYDLHPYEDTDYAAWFYLTQGISRIYDVDIDASGSDYGAKGFIAIVGEGRGEEGKTWVPYGSGKYQVCAHSTCSSIYGSSNNAAVFELSAYEENDDYIAASLDAAYVRIAQDYGATVTFDTTSEKIDGKPNALYQGGKWVKASDEARIKFSATDPGVGLSYASISSPDYGSWSGAWSNGLSGCVGVQCDPTYSLSRPIGNMIDGQKKVKATASNAIVGGEAVQYVKVDNGAPAIAVSGIGANYIAGLDESELTFEVADGVSKASSGVAAGKTSVTLDGEEILAPGGEGCSPGPCMVERKYSFVGRDIGVGEHRLVVEAEDQIGNEATKEFQFVVKGPDGPAVDLGPGQLNVQTGEFLLASSDVAEAAASSSLSMTRTYESLAPPALESPLGPNWQLSFGAWRRARMMADETFVIADTKGRQVVFEKVSGKYKAPAGYGGWALTPGEWDQLILTSPDGGTTTFDTVGQAPDDLYAPRRIAGPDEGPPTYIVWAYYNDVLRPSAIYAPDTEVPYCSPEGMPCRYLTFHYDSSTTASGNAPAEWGNYQGRLSTVELHAWDSGAEKSHNVSVVEYAYDVQGRLRAVWDPRISPPLKTTYGYNSDGRVTAVSPPGQQPWLMEYGSKPGNNHDDWLLSTRRLAEEAEPNESGPPESTEDPSFGESSPSLATHFYVWEGEWSGSPATYSYQWEKCDAKGESCALIGGATGRSYTPKTKDKGSTLRATVTATNAAGAVSVSTEPSAPVGLEPEPALDLQFGSYGTGSEQFKDLGGIALDSDGDVWVTDTANHRIAHYTADGEFIAAYGSQGSAGGQFKSPKGIAVDPDSGNLLVVDSGNSRIQELSPAGEFLQAWGSWGESAGKFKEPTGIAIGEFAGLRLVSVTDTGNDRVQRSFGEGAFDSPFGSTGSGVGQLKSPRGIAAAGSHVYVAELGNDRVQKFNVYGSSIDSFGSLGEGPGQLSDPYGLSRDPTSEDLLVTETGNHRLQKFSADGDPLAVLEGLPLKWESLMFPRGVVASGPESFYITDGWMTLQTSRVSKWVPSEPEEGPPPPPGPGSAVWTVAYDVDVSHPETLDPLEAYSKLGQTDGATEITAIFPPDEVPAGQPPQSYKRATIYYVNEADQITNTQSPGGRISTEEHDEFGNVVRTLTPENRARVLAAESGHKALSQQLDTQFTYSEDGSRLLSVLGPKHEVQLENGEQVEARLKTRYFYDEGAPEGGPHNLLTKQTEAALVGEEERDVRTKTFGYGGQGGIGWELGKPTSETTDPGGLDLTTTTLYEADSGNVIETRMPANPEGGDAHATRTIYYTALENEEAEECGERPEWAGLVCQTRPAAQPETPGLPDLPVTTTTYNIYNQPTVTSEVAGEATRTATIEYDDAGRPVNAAITASSGKALPEVQTLYDEETGLPTVQSTETEAIVSEYDSLGQLVSYTDADENTSTYAYDALGRVTQTYDGKGTQTFTYDETTGDLAKLEDTAVGTFEAEHDAGGKIVDMSYPNGLEAHYTYNAGGTATGLEYVDATECSEGCTWFKDEAVPSIHGETLSQDSTLAGLDYAYDDAGRLIRAEETPQGEGCTTRLYAYDADTNRTSATVRDPAGGGGCAESGGETQTTAFDEADRLVGEGIAYDEFGNVTALPGTYAGGKSLTSTYYADDTAATLAQDGVTIEYILDPAGRERAAITTDGEGESELLSHFAGDGDSPAWTEDANGNWTRYIGGMGGLTAIQSSTEGISLQIANLSSDIVATAEVEEAEDLDFIGEATEYGEPLSEAPAKYSWLGSNQRSTELDSGIVNMGARTYVPDIGRFLQEDPVSGGSANAYAYVFGDPVSESDLSGEYTPGRAPSWLKEFMEDPPGMPPPPPPPPFEAELFEEEIWLGGGGELEFLFGIDDIAGAVTGVIGPILKGLGYAAKYIGKAAGWLAGKLGAGASKTYRTATKFAIHAAKGAAKTAKSVANWVKQEFTTHIPQLIQCGEAAFYAVLRNPGDWKARAAAGALACRNAWRNA
jgi:RHS repeat-associated protein